MSFASSFPTSTNAGPNSVNTLWVGDLPLDIDESFLHAMFSHLGPELVGVKLIRSKETSLPAGYGFAEFRSHEVAEQVLKSYDGQPLPFPSMLQSTFPKPKTPILGYYHV
jgi:RNA recognition motif-containing protein